MSETQGLDQKSVITGSSVHKVEHLWRDVRRAAVHQYITLFHYLKNEGLLDPENDFHLFLLHSMYLLAAADAEVMAFGITHYLSTVDFLHQHMRQV